MLRPGLQGLLEAASAGDFEIVLTEALDRLSRGQADVAALYEQLSFAGIRIVTLAELPALLGADTRFGAQSTFG